MDWLPLSESAILLLINSPLAHKYPFLASPPKRKVKTTCCDVVEKIDYDTIRAQLTADGTFPADLLEYLKDKIVTLGLGSNSQVKMIIRRDGDGET